MATTEEHATATTATAAAAIGAGQRRFHPRCDSELWGEAAIWGIPPRSGLIGALNDNLRSIFVPPRARLDRASPGPYYLDARRGRVDSLWV